MSIEYDGVDLLERYAIIAREFNEGIEGIISGKKVPKRAINGTKRLFNTALDFVERRDNEERARVSYEMLVKMMIRSGIGSDEVNIELKEMVNRLNLDKVESDKDRRVYDCIKGLFDKIISDWEYYKLCRVRSPYCVGIFRQNWEEDY